MISVYTVNKNINLNFLANCLEGVASQSFKNFEYIFVDYGSDNVEEVYKLLVDKCCGINFSFYAFEKADNLSFIEAMVYAISMCEGTFVLRADSDDVMAPHCLKSLAREICFSDIVYSDYHMINEFGATIIEVDNHRGFLPAHALIRKDVYENIEFSPGQTFRDGTALEIFLKKNKGKYKVKHIKEKLFFYRKHDSSLTCDVVKVSEADKEIIDALD